MLATEEIEEALRERLGSSAPRVQGLYWATDSATDAVAAELVLVGYKWFPGLKDMLPPEVMWRASKVLFVDQDGHEYILQDRRSDLTADGIAKEPLDPARALATIAAADREFGPALSTGPTQDA